MKKKSYSYLIGIDEAGRGPLAGPVAVGVVCIAVKNERRVLKAFRDIHDSKKLSEKKRDEWFEKINEYQRRGLLDYAVSFSTPQVIDEKGIVPAVSFAMARGLSRLIRGITKERDCRVLLDGSLKAPPAYTNQNTIIRGDEKEKIISMASVAAKVLRDKKMSALAKQYPRYDFERHKGYGTKKHYENILKYGVTRHHRKSFLNSLSRQP